MELCLGQALYTFLVTLSWAFSTLGYFVVIFSFVCTNTYCLPLFTLFLFLCTLMLQYSPSLPGWILAVKSIKKQHLVEVRSMANPPAAVKLALESICLLLGESTTDWKQIRSIIMRENFIPTIVNFSAEEIRWLQCVACSHSWFVYETEVLVTFFHLCAHLT